MLHHPTLEKLQTLKLIGMIAALKEQVQQSDIDELSFEDIDYQQSRGLDKHVIQTLSACRAY